MNYNNRDEVPEKYKWDLTNRYKSVEDFKTDLKINKKNIKNILKYKGKILSSADSLFDTLEEYFKETEQIEKLYVYASIKYDEDLNNNDNYLMFMEALNIYYKFFEYSSFIIPEILKGNAKKYLNNKKISKYHFYLEDIIRNKEHTLSSKEEEIIAKLTGTNNTFSKINAALTDSILDYGTVKIDGNETTITNSNYHDIMTNKDINIRRDCFEKVSSTLGKYNSVLASSLVSSMKEYNEVASIRGFKSTLDMELFASNIPVKVVDNLYKVVDSRLDVFQKYFVLLKKHLGLNELNYYDINTDFLNNNNTFDIDDTKDLLLKAFDIYGSDYTNIIKKAFNDKWIDFGSYKGKKSGAYCTSSYGNNPVVLTNFHGKFNDVSAVAHELGHAVNFYLSAENNPFHESENDIFVAEVASLCNEIILSNYVMKNSKDHNLKLVAIYNLIDIIQNNLFDAALEGELEQKTYKMIQEGDEVNSTILDNMIMDIRKKYYQDTVALPENVKYLWSRRAHYFYPFYLFKYATGVSAAIYIATKIINNEDDMKEKYLEFLGVGERDYPVNLLKNIGVDMENPEVINKAIDYFDYLLDEFNKEAKN